MDGGVTNKMAGKGGFGNQKCLSHKYARTPCHDGCAMLLWILLLGSPVSTITELNAISQPLEQGSRHGESLVVGERPRMGIVITGHADHSKSTITGRRLADTGALPDGMLDQVRDLCARSAR